MRIVKNFRQRMGLTIVVTVGVTYIISLLIVGLLMNATTVTILMAQVIRLVIAIVVGLSVWNLLKKEDTENENDSEKIKENKGNNQGAGAD